MTKNGHLEPIKILYSVNPNRPNEATYEELEKIKYFETVYYKVGNDGRKGLLDQYGNPLIKPIYDDLFLIDDKNDVHEWRKTLNLDTRNSLIKAKLDGKMRLIKIDGTILFPFIYTDLGRIADDGTAISVGNIVDEEPRYGYAKLPTGEMIVPCRYCWPFQLRYDYNATWKGNYKYDVITRLGEVATTIEDCTVFQLHRWRGGNYSRPWDRGEAYQNGFLSYDAHSIETIWVVYYDKKAKQYKLLKERCGYDTDAKYREEVIKSNGWDKYLY